MAFTQKLSPEALEYFSALAKEPFSRQAVQFLNAYWHEVGDQAPFIFQVAYETVKFADMHFKGVSLVHLYDEGNDMDFNAGLYFYEKLGLKVLESPEGKIWREDPRYAPSLPQMMTAIVRKQELREKVDVNFDGRISFLEYLLYQYKDFCNPADFCERSMRQVDEHPEITRARALLDDVTAAIRAYEAEKARLEEAIKIPGVKGLTAKHTFAQLAASPLAEKLSTALIKAEAAVRRANRLFGDGSTYVSEGGEARSQAGAMYWMNADLEMKKTLYGRRAVAGHAIVGSRKASAGGKPQMMARQNSGGGMVKKAPPPMPMRRTSSSHSEGTPAAPPAPVVEEKETSEWD